MGTQEQTLKLGTTEHGTVFLKRPDGSVVVQRDVGEPAPAPPRAWMRSLPPFARFSADRSYVWYFGYQNKHPLVTLLSGQTLEVLGTHAPQTLPYPPVPPYYNDGDEPLALEHWGEDFSLNIGGDPSVAVFFANAGDSAVLLHALVATPEGISNPAGVSLVQQAMVVLDQRIFDAEMVGMEGLVMLGDVDDVYLLSWPEGTKVCSVSVDVPEYCECTSLSVHGDMLKVYYDGERSGHVKLNARTLAPYQPPAEALLKSLAGRLEKELGLVAHFGVFDGKPWIQGGGGYYHDDIMGFGLYEQKFEVRFAQGQYLTKVSYPDSAEPIVSKTPEGVLDALEAHFKAHHPSVELKKR